jgi:hypothetical protein
LTEVLSAIYLRQYYTGARAMFRSILHIALLVAAVPVAVAQDSASRQPPRICLSLPSGIPSETVQINYFMIGPFGGYGDFVRTEKGRSAYDIVASVDEKPTANVKVIAYFPGCEIATLEIPMQGTTFPAPRFPSGSPSSARNPVFERNVNE